MRPCGLGWILQMLGPRLAHTAHVTFRQIALAARPQVHTLPAVLPRIDFWMSGCSLRSLERPWSDLLTSTRLEAHAALGMYPPANALSQGPECPSPRSPLLVKQIGQASLPGSSRVDRRQCRQFVSTSHTTALSKAALQSTESNHHRGHRGYGLYLRAFLLLPAWLWAS
ncbi:hypothetical protein C8Q80DRAFT_696931 [Daedaleopsis nitida]|nr:hypothetical protein C8Q80DRAFT_696931 [Daedaleopsis nitida]